MKNLRSAIELLYRNGKMGYDSRAAYRIARACGCIDDIQTEKLLREEVKMLSETQCNRCFGHLKAMAALTR